MDKQTAINLLGGTPAKARVAMGYVSVQAVYMWPAVLSERMATLVKDAASKIKPRTNRGSATTAKAV